MHRRLIIPFFKKTLVINIKIPVIALKHVVIQFSLTMFYHVLAFEKDCKSRKLSDFLAACRQTLYFLRQE